MVVILLPIRLLQYTNRKFSRNFAIIGLVMSVWSVLSVELSLRWNRVSGVSDIASTGQVIPLVIGFGLISTVVWKLIWKDKV